MMTRKMIVKVRKAAYWKLVSEFVRREHAQDSGINHCVTCHKPHHWKDLEAGHFIPKKKGNAVYFDLRNIHPQCTHCNMFERGNLHKYYDYMLDRYGQETINDLKRLANTTLRISASEYTILEDEMKIRISKL